MSKKKKILILLVVLLLGGGYVAKGKLMAPKPVHLKINGTIYVLSKQFMCNLQGGHYATLTVALVLPPGQSDGVTAATADETTPSDGIGTLPEEAVVRAIITNVVTDQTTNTVISSSGRAWLEHQIVQQIRGQTDVKVTSVLFTDVAVQ